MILFFYQTRTMVVEQSGKKNMMYCAPNIKSSYDKKLESFTCFRADNLRYILHAFNKKHPKNKIPLELAEKGKERQLHRALLKKLKKHSPCEQEFCWLESNLKSMLKKNPDITIGTFRPKKPTSWYKKKDAWLSTTDIRDVILQNEFKHRDVEIIGPSPLDFDHRIEKNVCINDDLCKINLRKLFKKGKTKIGVVFNLDPHHMPGSHWVSLFTDILKGGIFYFDSVGKFPPQAIKDLMFKIRRQGNQLLHDDTIPHKDFLDTYTVSSVIIKIDETKDPKIKYKTIVHLEDKMPSYIKDMFAIFKLKKKRRGVSFVKYPILKVDMNRIYLGERLDIEALDLNVVQIRGFRLFWNDIKHQKRNTECGVYSIHFLENLCNGVTYENYTKHIIEDDEMNGYRDVYYRPSKYD